MFHPGLMEIARRDPRYAYEAYEFLFESLAHTQRMLGRTAEPTRAEATDENHVSGKELTLGIVDLAHKEFGQMARAVFRVWGINRTNDIGEIVFNLIEANLLSKNNSDSREDFHELFDLDEKLLREYEFHFDTSETEGWK